MEQTSLRIASAINQVRELRDLPITLSAPATQRVNDTLEFTITVVVDPQRVGFRAEEGRHRASLHLAVFCQDANEDPIGDVWQTMNLNLTPAPYEQVMRDAVTHTARVRVTRPVGSVKVAVYDEVSDRIGTAIRQMR